MQELSTLKYKEGEDLIHRIKRAEHINLHSFENKVLNVKLLVPYAILNTTCFLAFACSYCVWF